MDIVAMKECAQQARKKMIELTFQTGKKGAHIAPSLSLTDILTVLFSQEFVAGTDIFVLSKGHGALGYYCVLHALGKLPDGVIDTFDHDGGMLPGQPSKNEQLGIACSSGSLGMGISYAVGQACAAKKMGKKTHVYVLVGDGELNEGSNWEAAMLARQLELDNLTVIVDWNELQSDGKTSNIISIDLEKLWDACGWRTQTVDGHDLGALVDAFQSRGSDARPNVILAHTVKGKGVSFMENDPSWHHAALKQNEYELALQEVLAGGNK